MGKDATRVNGFDNLSVMEIDPSSAMTEMMEQDANSGLQGMMQDLAFAIPGIDEAMGFSEVMKQVKSMEFDCIVFDTAPTGHTLRFLSFPSVLEKALAKLSTLSGRFGPLMNQMSGLMGGGGVNPSEMFEKLESMRVTVTEVNNQFLSLYETERLIQELTTYSIDVHAIVVNQLLFPEQGTNCKHCQIRWKQQQKYLREAYDLYAEDFHIVKMPLLSEEVRGPEALKKFSELLIEPYKPAT